MHGSTGRSLLFTQGVRNILLTFSFLKDFIH